MWMTIRNVNIKVMSVLSGFTVDKLIQKTINSGTRAHTHTYARLLEDVCRRIPAQKKRNVKYISI